MSDKYIMGLYMHCLDERKEVASADILENLVLAVEALKDKISK